MSQFDRLIRVTLACGCSIRMRSKPMGPTVKYTCRSGLGHSYNQPWSSYQDNGTDFENRGLKIPKLLK